MRWCVLMATLVLVSTATSAVAQEANGEPAASPAATGPEALALPLMADPFAKTGDPAGGLDAGVRPVTPKRGAVIGGVIGGAAGVLFGAYFVYAVCDAAECHAFSSDTWKGALLFGGIGAAGGAAVGALFGWVDED